MIADLLDNWDQYAWHPLWREAFAFASSVEPDAEERRYDLADGMYAMVSAYMTKPAEEALFETHQEYIDLQALVAGQEILEWAPANTLRVQEPYEPEKDCALFDRLGPGPGRVELQPGTFVALFPNDAHAPGIAMGKTPQAVKKVVVKVPLLFAKP